MVNSRCRAETAAQLRAADGGGKRLGGSCPLVSRDVARSSVGSRSEYMCLRVCDSVEAAPASSVSWVDAVGKDSRLRQFAHTSGRVLLHRVYHNRSLYALVSL